MNSKVKFHVIAPVLPSSDTERDIVWYKEKTGFKAIYQENGYVVLRRENLWIHLQWHSGTDEDPIHGSVIKIFVEGIDTIFQEFVNRGTVPKDKLRYNTPWHTNEFSFYALNKNAVFFVEDV